MKTENGWKGAHIIVMEEYLGRPLTPGEYVIFKNGHNPPITIDMIELRTRGTKSKGGRIAAIQDRIAQLKAELDLLEEG